MAVLSLSWGGSAPAAQAKRFALSGRVTSVVDGDTVDVHLLSARRERIRLIGIDAPELSPRECFGPQAKTRARHLAQGKRVRIIGDATQDTRDRYRRLLAYVLLPGNRDLGRQLITEGFGKVYLYDRPFARLRSYQTAQGAANSAGRGIWTACAALTPQPPPPAPPPAPSPPPPPPTPPPPPPSGGCHVSYPTVCIPPAPPDLDCSQISHRNFTVRHDVPDPDPHGFDGDKDGVGCEN